MLGAGDNAGVVAADIDASVRVENHELDASKTMPLGLTEPGELDAARLGHRFRLVEGEPGLAIAGDAECRLAVQVDLVERLTVD